MANKQMKTLSIHGTTYEIVDEVARNSIQNITEQTVDVQARKDIEKINNILESLQKLPIITSDDNGKFLRVIDGSWSAATIPNAEEGSF